MIENATARVAPEKTALRPVLLSRLIAGALPERKVSQYLEKLKDPRWQKKRLQILERDEWCCRVCFDSERTLHVHHRYYKRGADPWDYPDSALVTLCEGCHEEEGGAVIGQQLLVRAFAHKGVFNDDLINLALAVEESDVDFRPPDWDVWLFQVKKLLKAMTDRDECKKFHAEYFAFLKECLPTKKDGKS